MAARFSGFIRRLLAPRRLGLRTPAGSLLEYVPDAAPADWLRESMLTFGESVSSFLPGHFEAYARLHHPSEHGAGAGRAGSFWREHLTAAAVDLRDPAAAEAFELRTVEGDDAAVGTLPPLLIQALAEHLRRATTTPECCYFAVWNGLGGSVIPDSVKPVLELPNRLYHVLQGPIDGAETSFSTSSFEHRSANLWWPADQAWCVATEIDLAWTYVGGARACIQALLTDPRLKAVETTAMSRW